MTKLLLSKSSQKFIKKLKDKNLKNKIKEGLDKIIDDYNVGQRKIGDLKNFWSLDIFYNKTNYEICYELIEDDGLIIIVVMIGTRENFYKELKRYIKDWFYKLYNGNFRDPLGSLLLDLTQFAKQIAGRSAATICQREEAKRTSICSRCLTLT